jgi:hypothetical protein
MYTAARAAREDELHARVPLSVAQWHSHENVCLPPDGIDRPMDWDRFGTGGAIASEAGCRETGGQFYPECFGWLVHVIPLKSRRTAFGNTLRTCDDRYRRSGRIARLGPRAPRGTSAGQSDTVEPSFRTLCCLVNYA